MKKLIKTIIISTSLLLVLFCFAAADGMIQSDRNFLHDYFGDGFTSEQWTYIDSVMDSCPYFITFQTSDGSKKAVAIMPYSSYYTYDDIYGSNNLTTPDLEIQISINQVGHNINLGYEYGRICPFGLGNISSSSIDNPYCYYTFGTGQEVNGIGLCVIPSGQWYDDNSTWHCRWYYSSRRSISGFDSHAIANWDYDPELVNCNFNARVIRGSYTITETYPQNVFPVTYTEDSRLQLSHIFGPAGSDRLLINMSEFYTETGSSPASGTTFSDVTLSVKFTDYQQQEIIQDFVLSSANSTITHSRYPSTLIHLVETPYNVFGNFSDYESVEIVGCSFTRTYSVITQPDQVEDFNISCSFFLKEAQPDIIESEEIPLPDYTDPEVVEPSEIAQIKQQLQQESSSTNANNGEWVYLQDHPVVPAWADHYDFRVIYSDANSFIGNLVNANIWNYYTSNDPNGLNWITSGFIPRDFINNNSSAMFYDMIIISVYEANVNYETPGVASNLVYRNIELQGYLVFYSERFYIHRQAITQQDILSSIQLDGMNAKLYYEYMKDKLDDFEDKSLLGINRILGLQNNTNSWLSSLDFRILTGNQYLQDIKQSIDNLDFPEPDLTVVTNKLEYLFVPSFSWESINYNDYLDSLGILSLPFRFGNSVFQGLENGYSPNLEYTLYKAEVPLPSSVGAANNKFILWDEQNFTLSLASLIPDADLLSNIRIFNLCICLLAQAYLTFAHIFRKDGFEEDGI